MKDAPPTIVFVGHFISPPVAKSGCKRVSARISPSRILCRSRALIIRDLIYDIGEVTNEKEESLPSVKFTLIDGEHEDHKNDGSRSHHGDVKV
jgi:hypothetical protein